MALSTLTIPTLVDTNFDYEAAEVVFSGSDCQLVPAFYGSSVILETVDHSRAGWDATQGAVPATFERVGYYHRFAFSFDSGLTWQVFAGGSWRALTSSAQIASYGMLRADVLNVRSWPDEADFPVRLGFSITRDTGGPTGSIQGVVFSYLATATDPDLPSWEFDPEVSGSPDEAPSGWNYPWAETLKGSAETQVSEAGYKTAVQLSTTPARASVTLTYPTLSRNSAPSTEDLDTVEGFFRDHSGEVIKLRRPLDLPSGDYLYFHVVSEPTLQQIDPDCWTLTVDLLQAVQDT